MTREEAEKYAENMTYREAIYNLKQAKSVPYRKATFIKINELLNELEQEPTTKNDLGVDAVSRQAINIYIDYILNHGMGKKKSFDFIKKFVTNLPSVTPQEQFKPMVEINLYSVIKQKYIEREVLDKIRAEIEQTYETDIGFLIHDETKRTILNIIDKYKAESEGK